MKFDHVLPAINFYFHSQQPSKHTFAFLIALKAFITTLEGAQGQCATSAFSIVSWMRLTKMLNGSLISCGFVSVLSNLSMLALSKLPCLSHSNVNVCLMVWFLNLLKLLWLSLILFESQMETSNF